MKVSYYQGRFIMREPHIQTYDLDALGDSLQASRECLLTEWLYNVLSFGHNPNIPLVQGLQRLTSRCYLDPLLFQLNKLERVCGPEKGMRYPLTQKHWDNKIPFLQKRIRQGWLPPPLLAPGHGDDAFKIADGSHRHEVLLREGFSHYWVLFFFDSEKERAQFLQHQINI